MKAHMSDSVHHPHNVALCDTLPCAPSFAVLEYSCSVTPTVAPQQNRISSKLLPRPSLQETKLNGALSYRHMWHMWHCAPEIFQNAIASMSRERQTASNHCAVREYCRMSNISSFGQDGHSWFYLIPPSISHVLFRFMIIAFNFSSFCFFFSPCSLKICSREHFIRR